MNLSLHCLIILVSSLLHLYKILLLNIDVYIYIYLFTNRSNDENKCDKCFFFLFVVSTTNSKSNDLDEKSSNKK